MKKIKLTENQLKLLIENIATPYQNTLPAYCDKGEISATANIDNEDEVENGEPVNTDKISRSLAIQNFWFNAHNGARTMP